MDIAQAETFGWEWSDACALCSRDAEIIMKGARVLRSNASFAQVVRTLMDTFLDHAGFEQGIVLRRQSDKLWCVAASTDTDLEGAKVLDSPIFSRASEHPTYCDASSLFRHFPPGCRPFGCDCSVATVSATALGERVLLVLVQPKGSKSFGDAGSFLNALVVLVSIALQRDVERAALTSLSQDAAIGEAINLIAHEVNQPLSIIAMSARNLVDMLNDGHGDEAVLRRLERIRTQAQRAGSIVQNMRRLSRMEGEVEVSASSLRAVLADVVGLLRPQFYRDDIEITVDLPEEDRWLDIAPISLQQVFLNIMQNARDIMQWRRKVADLSVKPWVRIRAYDGNDSENAVIEISDSGGGIAEDILPQIFKMRKTYKPAGQGTGVGLWIVHRLVEQAGGSVSAYNSSDGAVFTIVLRVLKDDGEKAA